MKILYLSHCCPYPPNKGEKIRTFHEIKYLSQNHEIHLACLTQNNSDLQYYHDLLHFCETVKIVSFAPGRAKLKCLPYLITPSPLSVPYFYHQELQRHIDWLLRNFKFDAIVCFSSPMAEYIFRAVKSSPNWSVKGSRPLLIMDFCDLDSDKWHQYAVSSSWPGSWIYSREARELLAYENRINKVFDYSIFTTRVEVALFKQLCPDVKQLSAIANGVDVGYFHPDRVGLQAVAKIKKGKVPLLLFTGAMDYQPNIDGVLWFCEQIYPRIRKVVPEVNFYIVGSRPADEIARLNGRDGITVTGFVDDIRPYYAAADLSVIPLRLARGVQNKVLEALAMARPVVSTAKALEGIDARPEQDLLVADTPAAFAGQVLDLLSQPHKRTQLGLSGQRFVNRHHSWDDNMRKLEELIISKVKMSS